jgi:hypothetical protein
MRHVVKTEYAESVEYLRSDNRVTRITTAEDGSTGQYDGLTRAEAVASFTAWLDGKEWRRP